MWLLSLFAIIDSIVDAFKESRIKEIPADNWNNEVLYYEDKNKGLSDEELMRNLENGKYRANEYVGKYGKPRYYKGKVIIENTGSYNFDCEHYGFYQAHEWAKLGKYNVSPKEKERQERESRKRFERIYSYL